jgi:hypothetical protein
MSHGRGAEGRRRAAGTCVLALAALALPAGLFFSTGSGAAHSWMGPFAHAGEHAHGPSASALSSWSGVLSSWWGIAIALLGLSPLCRGPIRQGARRPALAALSLLVGLLALESAVHSVHHLSDADAAAGCVVLSATQHVAGAGGGGADTGGPVLVASAAPVIEGERIPPLQPFRPFEGRAPPATPSV